MAKKKLTVTQAKKRAWTAFSIYIRTIEKSCFTCGYKGQLYGGHYIPKSLSENLRFHEKNVHAQCWKCNNILLGNTDEYAVKLEERYGKGVLEELRAEKKKTKQWTVDELLKLEELYKQKAKEL